MGVSFVICDPCCSTVIASVAKQSIVPHEKYGLRRRFVPLHKRFAFVAGNDGVATA
jgi:hypothetical protein